ncbi:formate dehydrogenase subunit gamma [Rhodococcoides trifolii]|uniref:Formate dehydrogenase subunit gamma n=1 Tax=Rhodococcoides trifolii TaxID=908250 RepID=A0A917G224_9NOCA|nr:cytochrome b/b6 domain-containing protein [Rhodococcus trifolii]GGG18620.1 formate dehydrogenase subunit gamma [Rhodococcus trifolii]
MTRPAELHRFGRAERYVHWAAGILVIVCILTAAVLYNASLAVLVGNRHLVELVHVWSGFLLPVPIVLGFVSRGYRLDVRRLGRFVEDDWKWLRNKGRRLAATGVGKFNAGQKLNGALSAGSIIVFLITGTVMYFTSWTPLSWRTGATFVHDWFALAFGILVVGHIVYALRDPEAMRGMRTGTVTREWADDEHPKW